MEVFEAITPSEAGVLARVEIRLPSQRVLSGPQQELGRVSTVKLVASAPDRGERGIDESREQGVEASQRRRPLSELELGELGAEVEKCARLGQTNRGLFALGLLFPSVPMTLILIRVIHDDGIPPFSGVTATLSIAALVFPVWTEIARRRNARGLRQELQKLRVDLESGVVMVRTGRKWDQESCVELEHGPEVEYEVLPHSGRR